jgi:uncharacterized protein
MGNTAEQITIIKLDYAGRETYRYKGRLLEEGAHAVVLEAFFDRRDTPVEELILKNGDRFVEYYFDDRWYNIFEIQDRASEKIKGWYCNIGHPAEFQAGNITYRDLALDLLVYPDGRQVILDQEEFYALPLHAEVATHALDGMAELQDIFQEMKRYASGLDGLSFSRFLQSSHWKPEQS